MRDEDIRHKTGNYVKTAKNGHEKNKLSTKEYLQLLDKLCTIPGRKHQ